MAAKSVRNGKHSLIGMYFFTAVFGAGCLYFAFQEARYSLTGTTATATVTHKSQELRSNSKGGGTHTVVVLDYSFQDASGTKRTGHDEVPLHWTFGPGETVSVEYLPGANAVSRVKGAKSLTQALLIFGIPVAVGIVILLVLVWHNSRASIALPPLTNSSSAEMSDSGNSEPPKPRGRTARKLNRQRERESPSQVNQQEIASGQSATPTFSPNSLVCRYAGWMGKPVSVIVDRDAGMIHFQNCHTPRKFWVLSAQPWFSCRFRDLVAAHPFSHKGHRSLTIVTQSGKALVSENASNYDSLCQAMTKSIPEGGRAITADHPALPVLHVFVAIGGFFLGLSIAPKGISDVSFGLLLVGSAFACVMIVQMAVKLLTR